MDSCTSLTVPARDFLHGALELHEEEEWVRPVRFRSSQIAAASHCRYWKSEVFVQMMYCTSGISLEFCTNAERCILECSMDSFPSGSRAVLDDARRAMGNDFPQVFDGFSVEVDGENWGVFLPHNEQILIELPLLQAGSTVHTIRIFLPCLTGARIGGLDVLGDNADDLLLEGINTGQRPVMVVCGDSLSQGFCAFNPARTYPRILADMLGMELVNHGIGGHVFQADILEPLSTPCSLEYRTPDIVLVEYGANYRYWACSDDEVRRDIEEYFSQLMQMWGLARVYVLAGMPHSEENYVTHSESCYARVPAMIREIAGRYENVTLLDGKNLVPLTPTTTADPDHLNAYGNERLAQSLYTLITSS